MCRGSIKLVNFLSWEQGPINNIVYKSKTSNMLLKIREQGPFNKLAQNTSRKLVKQNCTGNMSTKALQKPKRLVKN
jgi:hypothetical protein